MYMSTEFGRLGFGIVVYVVISVKCVRLNCTLNKLPIVRKFTVIIMAFILLYPLQNYLFFQIQFISV